MKPQRKFTLGGVIKETQKRAHLPVVAPLLNFRHTHTHTLGKEKKNQNGYKYVLCGVSSKFKASLCRISLCVKPRKAV